RLKLRRSGPPAAGPAGMLIAPCAWPASPALPEWAFYPSTAALTAKIDFHTPRWKWPFWVWTKRFGAWPFSVEWLSAAFDYNVAPFFQSFVEVRVEPSAGRVRMLLWGVHGRLRWVDLQASPRWRPADGRAGRAGRDRAADTRAPGEDAAASIARSSGRRRGRARLLGQRVQRVHCDQDL